MMIGLSFCQPSILHLIITSYNCVAFSLDYLLLLYICLLFKALGFSNLLPVVSSCLQIRHEYHVSCIMWMHSWRYCKVLGWFIKLIISILCPLGKTSFVWFGQVWYLKEIQVTLNLRCSVGAQASRCVLVLFLLVVVHLILILSHHSRVSDDIGIWGLPWLACFRAGFIGKSHCCMSHIWMVILFHEDFFPFQQQPNSVQGCVCFLLTPSCGGIALGDSLLWCAYLIQHCMIFCSGLNVYCMHLG